jgi:hypothetical protein
MVYLLRINISMSIGLVAASNAVETAVSHNHWARGWEMITAIGTVAIAVATFMALSGVWISYRALRSAEEKSIDEAKKQTEAAQKRLERETKSRAVDLLLTWAQTLSKEMMIARKIGILLDPAAASLLTELKPCTITDDAEVLVNLLLGPRTRIREGGRIQLNEDDVIFLRTWIVKYLNTLEAIMMAWKYGSADPGMLMEQFQYFFSGGGDMKTIRTAFNAKMSTPAALRFAYPAIESFVAEAKRINEATSP